MNIALPVCNLYVLAMRFAVDIQNNLFSIKRIIHAHGVMFTPLSRRSKGFSMG